MDDSTPRGIIRGVLITASVSRSARTQRPRKTPRGASARKTPVNPPSHAEVATRLLTRSRSANKRKATPGGATPIDSTTPRTLIAGYLQAAPVAESVVKQKKKTIVEKNASEPSITGTSPADDNTARITIQHLLREAIAETPEEPIFSSDVEDEDEPQQTDDTETHSPLISSIPRDKDKSESDKSVVMITEEVTMTETTARLLDSYEDGADAVQGTASDGTQELGNQSSVISSEALLTDTVITGDVTQAPGQWRDLVTPELPLNLSSTAGSQMSRSRARVAERSTGERPFFGGKPPAGKATGKSSKKASGPKMPSTLVKNILQHFSKAKVSKEALQAVENGSNLFFKRLSSDLMAYSRHARRSTIDLADVELLMKRQGFITDKESLYSLVEKYLPLEYRQEVIPTVQAGNKIVLK